jgi:hypothetical protein
VLAQRNGSQAAVATEASRPHEFFNAELLETYPDKDIPDNYVENNWLKLAGNITAYDNFVRGISSREEIRSKLEFFDGITLSDIQNGIAEIDPPEKFGQPSPLVMVLRDMFNVPPHLSLRSRLSSFPGQIRRLRFSYVLRAFLAYLVYQEIFLVEDSGPFWRVMEKCLYDGKPFAEFPR